MRRIEIEELKCAVNQMKIRKASVPPWVALKKLKAGGDKFLNI